MRDIRGSDPPVHLNRSREVCNAPLGILKTLGSLGSLGRLNKQGSLGILGEIGSCGTLGIFFLTDLKGGAFFSGVGEKGVGDPLR